MMYFKLKTSKQGVRCSECNKIVEKGGKYFYYFNYERSRMPRPDIANVCLECAYKVTSFEFLTYIRNLYNSLVTMRNVIKEVA